MHISFFSTIGSTTTGNHRNSSLMWLNFLGPAFLHHYQFSSDAPISLCVSTTRILPSAQLFCRMPPQISQSHAPSINQHIADGTFLLLPLLQPTNQSRPDAAAHRTTPGSSALFSSPLQHQANWLQAIHKIIQQFNQYLKAEHLHRQALQLVFLQLQNDFALMRYLQFSDKEIAVKSSAISRLIKPNPYPNSNPTSSAFPLPGTDDPKLRRSKPVGAVGPPRAKTNNSANADFQPTTNTQEAPPTAVQNLRLRTCKLENLLADEIATYTSITAGILSQYFFYMIKFVGLNLAIQMLSFGKFPQ